MASQPEPPANALRSKGRINLWGADVDKLPKSQLPVEDAFFEVVYTMAYDLVWSRDGLPPTTRRLVTLAILATLSRLDQFKAHVSSALDAGVTPDEIGEALIQVLGYAGMPTAVAAMLAFREVLTAKGLRGPDEPV